MFTVGVNDSSCPSIAVKNYENVIGVFPTGVQFSKPSADRLRQPFNKNSPPGDGIIGYRLAYLLKSLDPEKPLRTSLITMPMRHNIFNNPNISITPSSPLPKQPPIASASRPPWTMPVSPPVSIVPVTCEPDIVTNSKEIQKNSKRTAPYQISNRTIKQPRLSITKPINARKDYKPSTKSVLPNPVVNYQTKKNDTMVSSINVATSIPSTSNAVIQPTQKANCVQSTNEEPQPSSSELNCKDNSSHVNNDKKKENGLRKKFSFHKDELKLKVLESKTVDDTFVPEQEVMEFKGIDEIFEFRKSMLLNDIIIAMGTAMKKNMDVDEFDHLQKTSKTLNSCKYNWSTAPSTSSKKSPSSQNNINSINQPNQVGIIKSLKQTIIQPPSKQTNKLSNSTKQQSTSTNISSKIQHPTIIQTESKHHLSNNLHNNISLKHTKAVATPIQTSNKQIINSSQLPASSKFVSTTKKVVNLYQNVKPAIAHQSSVKDVKKCIKCKAFSEDETCAACHMSSHLKNVTVTRIETPSTSAAVAPESPIITHIRPIDVPSSSINSVSSHDQCVVVSSGEEEEEPLEPIITKVETKEALKKHTDKLCLNPKLLEDRLWQKDLSVKDYYKIEDCHSVHIGSFKTVPTPSGDMLVCLHGIRMTVKGLEPEPVTIDLQMDNVVKILGYHGENPLIIIYTNHLAAVGIQHLLNMNEDDKNHFYDPLSKDVTLNKIVWFFNLKRPEIQHLEKLLLKLSKRKYAPLTLNQVNKILCLKKNDEEEIKKLEKEQQDEHDRRVNNTTILEDKLGERFSVIKIIDYKMLNSNEFVNDILIEFYLDYWYNHKLSDEDRNRTYVFSTFFYTNLAKSFNTSDYPSHYTASQIRHAKVRKWTKNVDIFKKDFIFVPINENYHWFMAVICYPYLTGKVNMKDGTPVNAPDDNTGRYQLPPTDSTAVDRIEADPNVEDLWLFDSTSTQNYADKHGVDYDTDVAVLKKNKNILVKRPCILLFDSLSGGVGRARITATLRDWLDQEYFAKYGKKRDFHPSIIKGSLVKVPQQPNYTDCGLFAIHYFKRFFDRPIVDYTLPIRHLENWFSTDEVAKNCQKRRELQSIILLRMKERGSVLPEDIELPILNFTDPPVKTPQNPNQKNMHPSDVPNSTNRINSSNSKPSTSHYQQIPSHKYQNHVTHNNSRYQNHQYYDDHHYGSEDESEIDEEDIERQYNENDHYDEGFPEEFPESFPESFNVGSQREYYTEMVGNTQQIDYVNPSPPLPDIGNVYRIPPNNRNIVVNVNARVGNRRSFEYNNVVDEYPEYEIDDDDDDDDDDDEEIDEDEEEIEDEDEDEDFNEPNSTTNHNRRDNRFNHSRLSN
ncbi:uncharacterized protein LOC132921177 [Rhopalosiphum padi]|uniref:uncharacterized protein LOC132921177 n=1 Tax=Rhopalosiphum padi TaxID=40932 RepID=UPI00298D6C56|nr:uncharacterized protein LOC132921177 [Rhopalosiphum padi]XP_060840038.1 uncharacterized protein LOC132921177 [Rhopalosiphum padi]